MSSATEIAVNNLSRPQREPLKAKWCASIICKLKGFMFRRRLKHGERLILVEKRQGRLNTAIHMLAVFMPLGVLWIDAQGLVVDKRIARPWRFYLPAAPAKYVLEGEVSLLDEHMIGDELQFARNEHFDA